MLLNIFLSLVLSMTFTFTFPVGDLSSPPTSSIEVKHWNKQDKKLREQHASEHIIVMLGRNSDGTVDESGSCTAYSIGLHTLLTAEHCNIGNELYVDQTNRGMLRAGQIPPIEVKSRTFDHQDHMLLDLNEKQITFKHFLTYRAEYDTRLPQQGEKVHFWGNPSGILDQYREGIVMGTVPFLGSEIDATGPVVYTVQTVVVGGDSGSAVFGEDGKIVGIVTFSINRTGTVMGMFPLAFTQAEICQSKE